MTVLDDKIAQLRKRFVHRASADGALLARAEALGRQELETIAHRISGSAGMFGYSGLGLAAEAVEDAIRDQCDDLSLRQHIAKLLEEIDRIQCL